MTEAPPVERHYSVVTVAEMFDVEPGTVRRWIRREFIQARKINRLWRIPESEVKRLGESKFELPGEDEEV